MASSLCCIPPSRRSTNTRVSPRGRPSWRHWLEYRSLLVPYTPGCRSVPEQYPPVWAGPCQRCQYLLSQTLGHCCVLRCPDTGHSAHLVDTAEKTTSSHLLWSVSFFATRSSAVCTLTPVCCTCLPPVQSRGGTCSLIMTVRGHRSWWGSPLGLSLSHPSCRQRSGAGCWRQSMIVHGEESLARVGGFWFASRLTKVTTV